MVTINIGSGKDKLTCSIYKEFACCYSPLFGAAFIATGTKTIDLEEVTWPESFGIVQAWMYTQELESPFPGRSFDATDLCDIWILADRLLMPKLQNKALKTVIERLAGSGKFAPTTFAWRTQYLYDQTSLDSKLRSFLIQMCALWVHERDLLEMVDHVGISKDYFCDVSKCYMFWHIIGRPKTLHAHWFIAGRNSLH